MRRRAFAGHVGMAVIAAALCAGCGRIDVDLSSSPKTVQVGEPVTFDVAVMNRSTCPLGNVTALLFPFIPKNLLINRIEDPDVRRTVSDAVEAFCTGGTFDIPGSGGCQIANGEIICEIGDTAGNVARETLATTTMLTANGNEHVTCETNGTQLVCHIPQSMAEMGEHLAGDATANSLSPLVCGAGPGGQLGACFTLKLDPGETKNGQIVLTPTDPVMGRNWILAFAVKNQGVCKGGPKGTPCRDDSDCGTSTCGDGLCSGGARSGFGCDVDTVTDCPGDECVACSVPPDGQLLSNVACTTTNVDASAAPAPTLSPRGIAAAVALLLGVAYLAFRRMGTRTDS